MIRFNWIRTLLGKLGILANGGASVVLRRDDPC